MIFDYINKTKWIFFAERLSDDFPLILAIYFLGGQLKYLKLKKILYIRKYSAILSYRGEEELKNFYNKITRFSKNDFTVVNKQANEVFKKVNLLINSVSYESLDNLSEKNFKKELKNFNKILYKFCGYFIYLQYIGRALEDRREILDNFDKRILHAVRVEPIIHKINLTLEKILKAIGKKTQINHKLLLWSSPEELNELLKNNKVYNKNLKQKFLLRKYYYLLTIYRRKKLITADKSRIKAVINSLKSKDKDIVASKLIKGISAQGGWAKGVVKMVLNKKDFKKVNKGDIVVAITTMPYYFPVLKKAAAIIVDEGGLLTHAAIMSREFKKPCVIGTKIATKVLHDGDLVEVGADKGVVRILKRGKK